MSMIDTDIDRLMELAAAFRAAIIKANPIMRKTGGQENWGSGLVSCTHDAVHRTNISRNSPSKSKGHILDK